MAPQGNNRRTTVSMTIPPQILNQLVNPPPPIEFQPLYTFNTAEFLALVETYQKLLEGLNQTRQ